MEFKNFSLMVEQNKMTAFVDFLVQGKIMGSRCKKCDMEYYPPQADCSRFLSEDMEWFECPTKCELKAFIQVLVLPKHFALPPSSLPFGKTQHVPSPVGLLEVKQGIRIIGWIPNSSPEEIKIGDLMEASSQTLEDGKISIILKKTEN